MEGMKLAEIESKFVELVWEKEPVNSGELVALCEEKLNWKKSTTYTVLRRLCQRGILQNENATVTSKIKKEEYYAMQSEQFVEDTFQGSLPQFMAAFMSRKKLSKKQIEQIQQLIENYKEQEEQG
ncbi:MAG: BlaI/MecI/CopY family transcriptional regulator [Lachnospiraceae bacterium]